MVTVQKIETNRVKYYNNLLYSNIFYTAEIKQICLENDLHWFLLDILQTIKSNQKLKNETFFIELKSIEKNTLLATYHNYTKTIMQKPYFFQKLKTCENGNPKIIKFKYQNNKICLYK